MRALSLHQIVAAEVSPAEIIRLASTLGCKHVCLFTLPGGGNVPFPIVQDHEVAGLKRLMDDLGISVLGTTSFAITPEIDFAAYEAGLARSEGLGATMANARFLDSDLARVADNFARLTEIATRHGINMSIEPTGYGAKDSMANALKVIGHAGRGKICVDPLHIVRTGTLDDLHRLDKDMFGYVQFCDGPLEATEEIYRTEGGRDRLPPGDGEFPLAEMLALVPPHLPISLEVPQEPARALGASPLERGRRAVNGMRRLLGEATLAPAAAE